MYIAPAEGKAPPTILPMTYDLPSTDPNAPPDKKKNNKSTKKK